MRNGFRHTRKEALEVHRNTPTKPKGEVPAYHWPVTSPALAGHCGAVVGGLPLRDTRPWR